LKLEDSPILLFQHRILFEKFVNRAQTALGNGKLNAAVAWAQISVDFALYKHPGFYTNVKLESLLLEVANKISERHETRDFVQKVFFKHDDFSNKKHVLHVMTTGFGSGGHTRLLCAWIKNTIDVAVNNVVTTNQLDPLPVDLASSIAASGGEYQPLARFSSNPLVRSFLLRQLSRKWADVVVLHVHPSDAIPILAFGVAEGPPVIVLNHADHAFWLGTSIADVVADLRPSGHKITLDRRGIENSKIVPIPILKPNPPSNPEAIRKQFNLKNDQIVLLTVGDQFKYTSFGGYDFVSVMESLLRNNPNVVLFAVGPMQNRRWAEASARVDGRIKIIGVIDWSRLQAFYAMTDIYVEGFPVGGLTAMLEAGARGIPIIGVRIPEAPILNGSDDIAIKNFDLHTPSLETFTSGLENMISQPSLRVQKTIQVKQSIENIHFQPGWTDFLNDLMSSLPSQHNSKIKEPAKLAYGSTDIFWAGLSAAALENQRQQFLLDSILIQHAKYASRKERITRILKTLLRTNNMGALRNSFYVLRESAHGRL
jgi:glycosyltransferase involved in cell wall biosynthesis